jgi:hypothetical protein
MSDVVPPAASATNESILRPGSQRPVLFPAVLSTKGWHSEQMTMTKPGQLLKEVRAKLARLPRTGPDLYDAAEKPAEAVKGYLQMLLGVVVASVVAYSLIFRWSALPLSDIANNALLLVGGALALSAVIELAFTFFTPGPDEALDPLILGVSSFALINISMDTTKMDIDHMIPLALLALTLALLFLARRSLLGNPKGQKGAKPVSGNTPLVPQDQRRHCQHAVQRGNSETSGNTVPRPAPSEEA